MAVLGLALVATLVRPVEAQQLSSHQQTMHDEIEAGLDAVSIALNEVRAKLNAGDASAAGSAYNTTVRNYNNHVRRIVQLPAGNAATVALKGKADALGATLKETAAALKAGPAAQPGAQAGAPPGAKPVDALAQPAAPSGKLDYKQQQALKDARFYLNEVQPRAERIAQLTATKPDAEAIAEAMESMKFVQQRMGYAVERLNALPADNADVAAESKRYNDVLASLVTAQGVIEKAAPDADKAVAALGQQMTDDLAMVESWSTSLRNPQSLFDSHPDVAIAAVGQLPQMREAMADMLKRWTARANDKPKDTSAADMVRKLKYVDGQITELSSYTEGLSTSLPEQITTDLTAVDKLIETGVTERRPAYFAPDGGIAQQTAFAEQKVKMLKAINATAAITAEQSLTATRDKSLAAQKSLAQDIINGNKKPAERYKGADLEDLRQRVIADWKAKYPADEIVTVIFNTEGWSRTTRWDWSAANKGFGKVDYDYIQPKLFYKLNDTHALEMPVEVYKDYMKDSRIVVKPWDKDPEPSVVRTYLLTNLK